MLQDESMCRTLSLVTVQVMPQEGSFVLTVLYSVVYCCMLDPTYNNIQHCTILSTQNYPLVALLVLLPRKESYTCFHPVTLTCSHLGTNLFKLVGRESVWLRKKEKKYKFRNIMNNYLVFVLHILKVPSHANKFWG